jgi:hypothetical protein
MRTREFGEFTSRRALEDAQARREARHIAEL